MIQWDNCFSGIRFGEESLHEPERSQYERDYDRIIYSSPFRRLQNKTQVFPLPDAVFVHNRLTHSLEVASVGRSLGKRCGTVLLEKYKNTWDEKTRHFYQNDLALVISAACLAHDIGNPPFGHSGEDAIGHFFREHGEMKIDGVTLQGRMLEACWHDLLRFEGNANGFRLLTHHFPTRLPGGFRLTYTTLAAMAKYPCAAIASDKTKGLHRKKFGFFQADQTRFMEMAERLNMCIDQDNPRSYLRHPFVSMVEAADDICYLVMDWEDAHRLGIIRFEEARAALISIIEASGTDMQRVQENLNGLHQDANESIAYLRAKVIGTLIGMCVDVFAQYETEICQGTFGAALIDHIPESIREKLDFIRRQSVKKIYRHPLVARIEISGYEVMNGLLHAYIPAILRKKPQGVEKSLLHLMPGQYHQSSNASDYEKILSIVDFISGMTDIYALQRYQELKGIRISMYS